MDKEEVKPIVIAQFVFHPQTGEITFNYKKDISIAELLRIKYLAEEKVNTLQLEMTEASIGCLQDITLRLNRLNEIENKINALLTGTKVLLELKENEKVWKSSSTPLDSSPPDSSSSSI